mgnify:CR=1 FL=1
MKEIYYVRGKRINLDDWDYEFGESNINDFDELLDLGSADGSFIKVAQKNGLKSEGLDIDKINFENEK